MPWGMEQGQEAPWQAQKPMQKPMEIGPRADQKRREMLASVLQQGMSGKQPDVLQMYSWMK